jgi:phage tail sheath protein FI
MQWAVFEPNGEPLRADLRYLLGSYLRRLYRANAFAGSTEGEAFFVRCDDTVPQDADAGRLVALVGVAPVEPLEFLVVRITRDADGGIAVEGPGA